MQAQQVRWPLMICGLVLGALGLASAVAGAEEPASPTTQSSPAPFRVVGYLPDYRAEQFAPESCEGLTDLCLFSAEPSDTAGLSLTRLQKLPWNKLREFKKRQQVRLILCVGGWERSAQFSTVSATPELRRKFAQAALQICRDQGLDGVDLDWEHPRNATEQDQYGLLLAELRTTFRPYELQLSVTLAGWQTLPTDAFAAVDRVQVMAYDHEGQHATLEAARRDFESVRKAGVPAQKIVLGVPFYGRDTQNRNQTLAYRDIVSQWNPRPTVDEIGTLYFNGHATIRRKTEFALGANAGGIMIWEIGQDAPGDQSLLRVIRDTVRNSRR
ncbi:MAG: hypothetical protein JSS02_13525 [Planctomycetes bacterium]|nr:hypothetical protein [Planctomycetota bacterium]